VAFEGATLAAMLARWIPCSLLLCLPACCSTQSDVAFAETMGRECLTAERCHALLDVVTAARKECEVGRRPANCEEREAQYRVVKAQLALVEAHERAYAESLAIDAGESARDAETRALETQHKELSTETAKRESLTAAWTALDPKACALGGDEDACYALVRFLAMADDGPHHAEAREALSAGQRLIAEKKANPASPQ
jgi:hypothetical protein